MKIALYTLYNSFNYGAFLQAFALQEYNKQKGHDCSFAKVDSITGHLKHYRRLVSKKPGAMPFNLKKAYAFHQDWKHLKTHKKNEFSDIALCGSDEIWSVVNKSFISYPEFFGGNIKATIKASYAPSVGESKLEDFRAHPHVADGLRQLDFISVRDHNSHAFISQLTDTSLQKVLDPTFLIEWDHLIKQNGTISPPKDKYLLVYTYGFDRAKIDHAKKIAKKYNLKIISAGFYNPWCDEMIPCGAFDFLRLMQQADYVMTDTFHGSIFSILLKKNFVSFAKNKNKVKSLLSDLNLMSRDGDGHESPLDILSAEPDYPAVQKVIEELKFNSTKYLESVFSAAEAHKSKSDTTI